MYAIGIVPLLDLIAENCVNDDNIIKHAAFADDLGGAGKLHVVRSWWNHIVEFGPKLGYFPNATKSWIVIKPDVEQEAREIFDGTNIQITTEERKYLGGFIGSKKGKDSYVSSLVSSWCDQLKVLSRIAKSEPQSAYSAFVSGFRHRLTYHMSTIMNIEDHLNIIIRFPENVRNSLEELKDSLDETFNTEEKRYLARQKLHEIKQGSKESVIEFSERVDKLVMKGHDGFDSAAQKDRIASECFIKGLRQEIKETVWEKCPNSFQEAVQSAERREVFLNSVGKRSAGVNEVSEDLIGLIQKFNSDRERSNQEIWKAIQSLKTAVQELATARRNDNTWNHPPGAERRTPIVCYGCNQTGHIRRNCPLAQYRQPMQVNPALDRRCPAAEEPISEQTTPRS
eukprot:gene17855-biopygen15282